MSVDMDGPEVPGKSSGGEAPVSDAELANKLVEQHKPWLAAVSVEQLTKLVGRVRTGKMPKRSQEQGARRAPGRSPR